MIYILKRLPGDTGKQFRVLANPREPHNTDVGATVTYTVS
jgi:hypothetical protein